MSVFAVYDTVGHDAEGADAQSVLRLSGLSGGSRSTPTPSCYYDEETGARLVVALTLELDPNTGNFTGGTTSTSMSSNPGTHDPNTTTWKRYTIDTTDQREQRLAEPSLRLDPEPERGRVDARCVHRRLPTHRCGPLRLLRFYHERVPVLHGRLQQRADLALSSTSSLRTVIGSVVQFSDTKLVGTISAGRSGYDLAAVVPGTAYDNDNTAPSTS